MSVVLRRLCSLLVCAAFSSQGCVVYSHGTFSVPVLPASDATVVSTEGLHWYGRQVGDTFRVGEITLTIFPQNEHVSLNVWGFLVPFIPLPGGINQSEFYARYMKGGPTFLVRLIIAPRDSDYAVHPNGVRLRLASGAELSPSAFWGPQWPGHQNIGCDPSRHAYNKGPRGPNPITGYMGLLAIDKEICLTYVFDTAPPSPKEVFTLFVVGIRKGDRVLTIPPIEYRPQSGGELDLPVSG